jgi:hypothetical protein
MKQITCGICKQECAKSGRNQKFCSNCARIASNRRNRTYRTYKTYKSNKLKHKFGITLDDYFSILVKQKNKCAICCLEENSKSKNGKIKNLSVDHCHKTKKVRGLLCDCCNRGLGCFKDNKQTLQKAIEYLIDCD